MKEIPCANSIAPLLSAWAAPMELDLHARDAIASRLSGMKLQDLVVGLMDLDESEAANVESLSGSQAPMKRSPERFCEALEQTIRQLRLFKLFSRNPDGEHQWGFLPTAYNERTGEHYPKEMARWREDFRAMSPERQMIAATIIWLYRAGRDSIWLRRVPCTWRASEALHYMRDAGSLSLWLRLIARYPSR